MWGTPLWGISEFSLNNDQQDLYGYFKTSTPIVINFQQHVSRKKESECLKDLRTKVKRKFLFFSNCVPLDSVELLIAPQHLAKNRHSRAVETNDAWCRERGQDTCSAHLSSTFRSAGIFPNSRDTQDKLFKQEAFECSQICLRRLKQYVLTT